MAFVEWLLAQEKKATLNAAVEKCTSLKLRSLLLKTIQDVKSDMKEKLPDEAVARMTANIEKGEWEPLQ